MRDTYAVALTRPVPPRVWPIYPRGTKYFWSIFYAGERSVFSLTGGVTPWETCRSRVRTATHRGAASSLYELSLRSVCIRGSSVVSRATPLCRFVVLTWGAAVCRLSRVLYSVPDGGPVFSSAHVFFRGVIYVVARTPCALGGSADRLSSDWALGLSLKHCALHGLYYRVRDPFAANPRLGPKAMIDSDQLVSSHNRLWPRARFRSGP